jgi:PAS domain S-box-containing protein
VTTVAATLRLAALVESSDDAIISEDLTGTIETWNLGAEHMFGYSAAEMLGRSNLLIVPADRIDEERAVRARIERGEAVRHFETVRLTKLGALLPVSLSLTPLLGADGELTGVARIARDITRQRALEQEALRLAAVVNSSDDAIISKDLRGTIASWNPAAERIFGYTAAEAIGKSIRMLIPADRQHEEETVLARVCAGAMVDHFETVRVRKDGSLVNISLSVSPVRNSAGQIVGASKIARDVSTQKQLERQAFRLAAIVDSSEDAIVSKDLAGTILTWNRAAERMFGYTAAEAVGRSIRMIIPNERQAEEDDLLARVRSGSGVDHFETVRQRKDGTTLDVSLSTSPVRDRSGAIIGASKIARDITTQKRLLSELEEANRTKDEFLATLSHELRTPLNAVMGYLRIVRSGRVSDSRREQILEVLERNAAILSQLVSDLLSISSIVTGKMHLSLTRCDIAATVRDAIEVVQPAADAKGIVVSVTGEDADLVGRADADRLQQVFWNLLSNAVKFTRTGGRIDIALARTGTTASVTIADTGVGITPDFLPFVFQRFRQAESVFGREIGGLGLGLALVRHFVELHGGEVTAESAGEGKGATFQVTLPLLAP